LSTVPHVRPLYLNVGTGEPWAGQDRATAVRERRVNLEPLFSRGNLGPELPTGSRVTVDAQAGEYYEELGRGATFPWL
jgi:hypothetical protein